MNHFYSLKHEILFLTLPDLYLIVKQLNGNPCTMQSLPSRLNCMVSRDSSPRALWNDFAWAPLDSLLGIHSEWNTVRFGCVLQCSCFAKRLCLVLFKDKLPFTLVTRRSYCRGRPKELCFTTLSLAMETMGMRLSVVKQSFFGPLGQYGPPCDKGKCNDGLHV